LVEAIPELAGPLESFFGEWGHEPPEPGLVNLADNVLFPFVEKVVRTGEPPDLLERLFGVLERMATHPDAHVRERAASTRAARVDRQRLMQRPRWSRR
jgi:hypothetical protein